MANEARVVGNLQILKKSGNVTVIDYRPGPSSFTADVNGTNGPRPGTLTITPQGVDVDLSGLVVPGLGRIFNQDAGNFVDVGIHDGHKFMPLLRVLPGESYPLRLSPDLGLEFTDVGTGTSTTTTCRMQIRSYNQDCNVVVEFFEE